MLDSSLMAAPLPLVIVGFRKGLYRAARARGFTVWVVDDSEAGEIERAGARERFALASPEKIEEALALLPPKVGRIFGVAERMVVAAAGLREWLGVPGLSVAQTLAYRDKLVMKQGFHRLSLPCARHAGWPGPDLERLVERVGFPLIVKPRFATSGVGRRILTGWQQARRTLPKLLARFPQGLIAEERFRAREVSVESFVSRGQLVFRSMTDYVAYGMANRVPAVLDPATARRLIQLADRATLGLGLTSGVTHAEFFLTESGPVISEIACRPPGGHIFELIELAWGVNAWELYLSCLLDEPVHAPRRPTSSAGNLIYHPHQGRITRVRGLPAVARLPGVVTFRHSLKVGTTIGERTSLGQMKGVVTVVSRSPAVVQRSLRRAAAHIQVEVEAAPVEEEGPGDFMP